MTTEPRIALPTSSNPTLTPGDSATSVRIRPYTVADKKAVREVLEMAYGARVDPEPVYDWWSMGYLPDSTGYMVADSDGRVVGAQPMDLFAYVDGTTEMLGGLLTGVAVHPNFGRKGIFTALVAACEAEAWRRGAAFVTTMPNDLSRPGFLKMGYVDLGQRRLLVRLLRPGALGAIHIPLLGYLAGGCAGAVQSLVARPAPMSGVTVREVSGPADSWTRLFERNPVQHPGLWLKRNARWLEWRYAQMPFRRYRYFEAHTPESGCAGALITTQEVRASTTIAYVMEMAVERDSVVGPLLHGAFTALESDGVHAIAAVVSSATLARSLRAAGFVEIPAWAPIKRFYSVVRFNPELPVPAHWQRIDGWQQTLGDWDSL